MKKVIDINTLGSIYQSLTKDWALFIKDLHLSNKDLYNLISLKREIEHKYLAIQETVATIMKSYGAEELDNGGLRVAPEKIPEVNKELEDLARQPEEIEYKEITIREGDSIPPALMEIIYAFIVIE